MPQYRLINNIISFVCWRLAFLVGIILIASVSIYPQESVRIKERVEIEPLERYQREKATSSLGDIHIEVRWEVLEKSWEGYSDVYPNGIKGRLFVNSYDQEYDGYGSIVANTTKERCKYLYWMELQLQSFGWWHVTQVEVRVTYRGREVYSNSWVKKYICYYFCQDPMVFYIYPESYSFDVEIEPDTIYEDEYTTLRAIAVGEESEDVCDDYEVMIEVSPEGFFETGRYIKYSDLKRGFVLSGMYGVKLSGAINEYTVRLVAGEEVKGSSKVYVRSKPCLAFKRSEVEVSAGDTVEVGYELRERDGSISSNYDRDVCIGIM